MTIANYLPIHIQRSWYHLLLAFILPALQAAIFGYGGALIIGFGLSKLTDANFLKPVIFTIIFCWQFWKNGLPRLRHWFWRFELSDDRIRLTTFRRKQISFLRSEITGYEETSPPIIRLTSGRKNLCINWTVMPVKERIIVTYWLGRWVLQTALPTELQEKLAQFQANSKEIEQFKQDSFQTTSSRETIRGIRALAAVISLATTGFGIYLMAYPFDLGGILSGVFLIVSGLLLSFALLQKTQPVSIIIDERGLQLISGKKQQEWKWDSIEAIQIRFPAGRPSEMKLWIEDKAYNLPIAYLDSIEQFTQKIMRHTYARKIPFHIWKA
ncbi:MAG: hypothetical protein H6657_03875 [Ardenticatenaceae bacterium]|nr:hypothetical protein [Anaerolineales bacterium]MCB8976543.1 hypothetical protein [Ardenticatenaceae bacterium]